MQNENELKEAIAQAILNCDCGGYHLALTEAEALAHADAVLPLVAEAEQQGYERGYAEAEARAVDIHADLGQIARQDALAEARAKIEALDYSDTQQRRDVLAVLDSLRGGAE